MRKIPCLFQREFGDGEPRLLEAVTPGCEWVLQGEGFCSVKWDGTAVLIDQDGKMWKRYDRKVNRKSGKLKDPPEGWMPCQPDPDDVTGHWPGWAPVTEGPEDRWHREASAYIPFGAEVPAPGTYELIGPKINGNPHRFRDHVLERHGQLRILCGQDQRTFEGLRGVLETLAYEGLVFWRDPEGSQMAKIRRRDYGLQWPPPTRS